MARRIILLNQYYAPDEAATAQMLGDLGAALAAGGYEVTAICCDRSYADPSRRYPRREVIDGVHVERAASAGFGRSRIIGRLADYLTFILGATRRLLSGPRPDVVISLTTPPFIALIGTLCARLRGARSIFWSMDMYPDLAFALGTLKRTSLIGRILSMLARVMLRHSDLTVALGQTMREKLLRDGAREVEVIPNWADEESIVPIPIESHPLRERWGWQRRFVILYSGNMGLAHEFETVISAANKLIGDSNILFTFVGGGPRVEEVRTRVSLLALTNVEFRPYVPREDLGNTLTAANLHLVTLQPEVAGLLVPSKIYGILAAGRPTLYVGPREGEIADLIRQGRCGAQVDNGETDRLAVLIREYAKDGRRCWEEGERARRLFENRYSSKQSLSAWVRCIETL